MMRPFGPLGLAALLTLGWAVACSDSGTGPGSPPITTGLIISDPGPASTPAAPGVRTLSGAPGNVVYISLEPGTEPTGASAELRNLGSGATVLTAVQNGGFDPAPVAANAGDVIEVVVRDKAGTPLSTTHTTVAMRLAPSVVRTDPPHRKRDVALNYIIGVVFSEPVNVTTLSPSTVQLLQNGSPVSGTVTLLQGTATEAVFTPGISLAPNTDYRLVVTSGVQDLQGDPLAAATSVDFTTGTTTQGPANFLEMRPDTAALGIGNQVQVTAIPIASPDTLNPSAVGGPITGLPITWSSADPTIATVSPSGLVTALAPGVAHIQAEVDQQFHAPVLGVTVVLVSPVLVPVASVQVTPSTATVPVTGTIALTAVAKDAAGNVLPYRPITWASGNGSLATVTPASGITAVATGAAPGTATITATSEGVSGSAAITVVKAGPYLALAAGEGNTCGVTTDFWAFCWGTWMSGSVRVPTAVTGGVHYSQVATGENKICALEPGGAAHCWGGYPLGDGSDTGSVVPVAVSGGLQFASIGPGSQFTCGLTTARAVYCWGNGGDGGYPSGMLGTGNTASSAVPVPVTGGHSFTALAVGYQHSCALTSAGAAWCWGRNAEGELGDSDQVDRASPIPVRGGHVFVALTAGWFHTCGLLSNGSAWCWGNNLDGELGTTTSNCSSGGWPCNDFPVPVSGSLRFARISAGANRTCAITGAGAAYCWGSNGVTGPVAVPGGLSFASISSGYSHWCGITTSRVAYCWGDNSGGQFGDGTTNSSNVPVRVSGQP